MNVTDKLLQLKSEIDQAKTKVSELTGRKQGLTMELKNDWNCTTLKQVENKAKDLEQEVADLSARIDTGVAALEEKYEL